jgi:hypothetical protein
MNETALTKLESRFEAFFDGQIMDEGRQIIEDSLSTQTEKQIFKAIALTCWLKGGTETMRIINEENIQGCVDRVRERFEKIPKVEGCRQ